MTDNLDKELWPILEELLSNVPESVGAVLYAKQHTTADIKQLLQKKEVELLEHILANASGGGSWRRVIISKLAELKAKGDV